MTFVRMPLSFCFELLLDRIDLYVFMTLEVLVGLRHLPF